MERYMYIPEKAKFNEMILNFANKKTISGVIVASNGFAKNYSAARQ